MLRRFSVWAAAFVLALALAALAFAAGSGDDTGKIIKEMYSIKPVSAPANEEFKASPVGLPEDMHVGVSRDAFSVEMGDVMLNPIPRPAGN